MGKLSDQKVERARNSKIHVFDLSNYLIQGKALYAALLLAVDYAKEGRFRDAAVLPLHGMRLFLSNHIRRIFDDWGTGNLTLDDFYHRMDEAGVPSKRLEEKAYTYIGFFNKPGSKEFLEREKSEGKKLLLLTREADESLRAAMRHYGCFDGGLSNKRRLKPDGKSINDADIIFKNPEDKWTVLEKEVEKYGFTMNDVVIFSNNIEEIPIFGEERVINTKDFYGLSEQLYGPDQKGNKAGKHRYLHHLLRLSG